MTPPIGDDDDALFFDTLEQAAQHPDAVVDMRSDYGGIPLLIAPVSRIACDADVLEQLLIDIHRRCGGGGADLTFRASRSWEDPVDDIWFSSDVTAQGEAFCQAIADVIHGKRRRISED